jgi:hypothetical protein
MQRIICCILAAIVLFSLTGCSGNGDIVGIWEQEMEMSILGEGIEEATSVASLCRFTFREDGSAVQAELTSCGLGGDALPDRGEYPAYIACCLFTEKHSTYVEYDAPKIVLENGRVVEQGTHDELMARNGAYTTLVKNQAPTSVKKDVDPRKIPV